MSHPTLGEALESALASILNEVGDEVAGTRLDAVKLPKGARTIEGPGQVREEIVQPQRRPEPAPRTTQPGTAPASLGNAKGRRAHPHELAPLGARQPLVLVVDNGGRPATSGGTSRAAYRAATGEGNRVREFLKLVV